MGTKIARMPDKTPGPEDIVPGATPGTRILLGTGTESWDALALYAGSPSFAPPARPAELYIPDGTHTALVRTPEKTPPRKKLGPAGGKDKPGVIASIVEFLRTATSPELALTVDEFADALHERFPERGRDSVRKTAYIQLSGRLQVEKKLPVRVIEKDGEAKRYWYEGK